MVLISCSVWNVHFLDEFRRTFLPKKVKLKVFLHYVCLFLSKKYLKFYWNLMLGFILELTWILMFAWPRLYPKTTIKYTYKMNEFILCLKFPLCHIEMNFIFEQTTGRSCMDVSIVLYLLSILVSNITYLDLFVIFLIFSKIWLNSYFIF